MKTPGLYFLNKSFYLSFLLSFLHSTGYAQTCSGNNSWEWKSQSNWLITGKNILQFNNNKNIVQSIGGGKDIFSDGNCYCQGFEGTTSPSDDQGNLIFYSAGKVFWDKNYLKKGTFKGNATSDQNSAVQGILTVRHPLVPDLYYVFTGDDEVGGATNGFHYHVVDKNGTLITPATPLGFFSFEGMNATRHTNGVDIWITTLEHGTGIFKSFLLTCNGLNTTPVNSPVGCKTVAQAIRGALEFSPDGTKVGVVHHAPANRNESVMIMDFNRTTGVLSNSLKVSAQWSGWGWSPTNSGSAYDCEFSPDGSRLYITFFTGGVEVYDLSSNNESTIFSSVKLLNSGGLGCLEMGPDGKMYHNNSGTLMVSSGNLNTGAVNFVSSGLTGFSGLGLPNMYLPPQLEPDIQEAGPFCNTDEAIDLNTTWLCLGSNAEDPNGNPTSVYSGKGITDSGKGIFDPKLAGEGIHRIIFTKCSVDDTIFITVNKCSVLCPDTSLKNITPICVGSTVDLNAQKITTENGTWSIQGNGANYPTLAGNIFTTTANTTSGSYLVRYTLNPLPLDASCPAYAERTIKINKIPSLTFTTTEVCEGSTLITFNGSPAGGTYRGTDIVGNTFNPVSPGSTTIIYVYTDNNGCNDSITSTQTINAKPNLVFTTTPVCEGSSEISFSAAPAGGTYSGSGSTFNPIIAGTTAITYSYTNGKGCNNSITTNQVVNAKPIVTFTTTPVCEASGIITFNGIPTGGIYSGAGISGTTFNPVKAGMHDITYTYTDANGCIDSAKASQEVSAKPIVSLHDQSICPGSTAELDAGIGDGSLTYSWAPNGENTQKIRVKSDAIYSVKVTNNNDCFTSDTAMVTVNADLNIDLGPDQSICAGESQTFTANYAGSGIIYIWSGPNTYSNSTKAITVSDAGTYHVNVSDPSGCTGNDEVRLIVNSLPAPTLSDGEICEGTSHIFDAGTYDFYQWSTGETSKSISTSQSNTFTITVTDGNGCKGNTSANLIVHANPTVDLGNDYTGCKGSIATFNAGNPGANYVWSNDSLSQSIQVNSQGRYSVTVTDNNGCKGHDTVSATFVEVPQLEIGDNIHLCEGQSASVSAEINPASSILTWSTKENKLSITVNSAQIIIATANNGGGMCSAKDTLEVFVHENPATTVLQEQTLCFMDSITLADLDAEISAFKYLWNTGDTTKSIRVKKEGVYSVDLISKYGCLSSEEITVNEKCESSLFVPNAFTPKRNGINDVFYVKGQNVYDFEMWIFDRWGEMIYHTTNISEGWNGKRNNTMEDAQIDVYVWKINYRFWEDQGKRLREKVGHVSLIR